MLGTQWQAGMAPRQALSLPECRKAEMRRWFPLLEHTVHSACREVVLTPREHISKPTCMIKTLCSVSLLPV